MDAAKRVIPSAHYSGLSYQTATESRAFLHYRQPESLQGKQLEEEGRRRDEKSGGGRGEKRRDENEGGEEKWEGKGEGWKKRGWKEWREGKGMRGEERRENMFEVDGVE